MKGRCDICGRPSSYLNKIVEKYRTEEVSELCELCLREANVHLSSLQKMTFKTIDTWQRRYLRIQKKFGRKYK